MSNICLLKIVQETLTELSRMVKEGETFFEGDDNINDKPSCPKCSADIYSVSELNVRLHILSYILIVNHQSQQQSPLQLPAPNELPSHDSPSCDSQSRTVESPSQESHAEERPESPSHESHSPSNTPSPHSPVMNEDCDVYVSIIIKVIFLLF